jgi:ATP-dependent DNA helicase DinG
VLQRLEELTNQFFALFGEADRRVAFHGRDAFREDNEEAYDRSGGALDLVASHLRLLKHPPQEILPLFRRAVELNEALRFLMESDDERYVFWVEKRGRGCFLQATPIDVAKIVPSVSSMRWKPVVLTSATLAWRAVSLRAQRLGLEHSRDLVCPATSITRSKRSCMCRSRCRSRAQSRIHQAASEEGNRRSWA